MVADAVGFSCACGKLGGEISPFSRRSGTHTECFCKDCRAAEIYLGQPDPAPGGVHIFQITPDLIHFTHGQEHLALFQLSPKGIFRWYASCCNSPLFNTLSRPGLPFAGLLLNRLSDPAKAGRVATRSFVPDPNGGQPRHKGAAIMAWRLITRMGAARLSGRWRQNPFFDMETSTPVVTPKVLTKAERDAATRT